MRKFIYLLIAMAVIAAFVLLAIREKRLPTTLDGLYAKLEEGGHRIGINSPFSGVALVAKDDEVLFKQAYGYSDVDGRQPLTVDSRFIVGAGAKPLTAVLVLQQVEAGTLELQGTVSDYLPDFAHESGDTITLHQLLTHTSGLPRGAEDWDQLHLDHTPGTTFQFSNAGYDLLITILLEVTGSDYGTLLEEGITAPLGMNDTAFAMGDALTELAVPGMHFNMHRFPASVFATNDGSYETIRMPVHGAVISTVTDLHDFVIGLRDGNLLSATLTAKVFEPALEGITYGWRRNEARLFTHHPSAPFFMHEGILAGHAALITLYDEGTTMIILSNVRPLRGTELLELTYLAAHGVNELETEIGHPSLSHPRAFEEDGGVDAFLAYYREMSKRAGYSMSPDNSFCAQVVRLLVQNDKFDEATEFVDTIVAEWPPTSPEMLNDIGYAFMLPGQAEIAKGYLQHNIELFPDVANGYDSLGEAYQRTGDYTRAREQYVRALDVARANGDDGLGFHEWRLRNLDTLDADDIDD